MLQKTWALKSRIRQKISPPKVANFSKDEVFTIKMIILDKIVLLYQFSKTIYSMNKQYLPILMPFNMFNKDIPEMPKNRY